jgi:hypothetical protein
MQTIKRMRGPRRFAFKVRSRALLAGHFCYRGFAVTLQIAERVTRP